MIDFDYTAPELLPFRIQEVLDAPNEPHKIGGVVYVPKSGDETEYDKLFGTPERAAQTMALQCFGAASEACDTCVLGECDGKLRNSGAYPTVYDALLEWLKQEVDA